MLLCLLRLRNIWLIHLRANVVSIMLELHTHMHTVYMYFDRCVCVWMDRCVCVCVDTVMTFVLSRLLQGGSPRHKLVKQSSQPTGTAFSAFNPPNPLLQDCTHDSPERTGWCGRMTMVLNTSLFNLMLCFILCSF